MDEADNLLAWIKLAIHLTNLWWPNLSPAPAS